MKDRIGYSVILDCYTDEPSGYGVRPYLGVHQIHLSQALASLNVPHFYLTIDDLRYCSGDVIEDTNNTDLRILNRTKNCDDALSILNRAETIYIIMGCFVDYSYFSAVPPKSNEVYKYLRGCHAKKILFYVLGTTDEIACDYADSPLSGIIDHIEFGNAYRWVLENGSWGLDDLIKPNYNLLDKISSIEPPIISQLCYPIIAEIETGTGCNLATCIFCIECSRRIVPTYRDPRSIAIQVKCIYDAGVRHFRLGRQPNFYYYQNQSSIQVESLLSGIRDACPDLETLHIDNANIVDVVTPEGQEITKLIARYCTSGNIAALGIESFDSKVRKAIRKAGTAEQALRAIEILNEHGQKKGNDGFPLLLPGINLIYGLPEQDESTQQINLDFLRKVLDNKWQTRRLFFRKMTRPTGISFGDGPVSNTEYDEWFREIVEEFVMPMQDRVYPIGTVLKGFREVVWKEGDSYLRTLGTCSIRVVVRGHKLRPYDRFVVRVTKNVGYRLLEGELI